MTNTLFVTLQAATGGANPYMSFIMIALIIVVFYLFMIRPQMKRQKELRKFQESLQKGDKVIIAGGIFGKVFDVKDDHIVVEVSDNVKIKVVKSTVLRDSSDLLQK
ncbi:MAG TPA: preprotein translocase subunit YajC [Perlabentimonas sp.]|jgi:preprotein translocase subunit YajC|nr:preprotein translocase subunit YajC [Bacteroidales bacterium]MDD4673244.1 preprotein translocase subunit YajC [Bacteroidales bacterium]MDY0348052.1 preprotein translocase subunit YajC [Tenuifilaceae bacterium]HZJ74323.1 preprotein translocase subunit YajC [Perlabentimonas sp.]